MSLLILYRNRELRAIDLFAHRAVRVDRVGHVVLQPGQRAGEQLRLRSFVVPARTSP